MPISDKHAVSTVKIPEQRSHSMTVPTCSQCIVQSAEGVVLQQPSRQVH
jgi:hypothetical protein